MSDERIQAVFNQLTGEYEFPETLDNEGDAIIEAYNAYMMDCPEEYQMSFQEYAEIFNDVKEAEGIDLTPEKEDNNGLDAVDTLPDIDEIFPVEEEEEEITEE